LIVRWPGQVKPKTTCDTPVISTDFFPTLIEAAGLTSIINDDFNDGVSLIPLLRGGVIKRDAIYFHYPNYAWHRSNRLGSAIRSGQYKLIERFDNGDLELFDLKNDLSERKNLAIQMPDRAKAMHQKLAQWRKASNAALPTPNPQGSH
jgi:arylsulfatase A-like enzyme